MLIKKVTDNTTLVFIKSKNINVFPSGRRRSAPVDRDGDNNTVSDKYYIPFDPEARLNTELNNRRHSALNGFTSSYFYEEADDSFTFVINGYLFKVLLDGSYASISDFAAAVAGLLPSTEVLYANIFISDIVYISGNDTLPEARTKVLRDQYNTESPDYLDVIPPDGDPKDANTYYFSGVSFSARPFEAANAFSLPIFEKSAAGWAVKESSRLPNIKHGDTVDSIKVAGNASFAGDVLVDGNITIKNSIIPVIKLDPATNQLQLFI